MNSIIAELPKTIPNMRLHHVISSAGCIDNQDFPKGVFDKVDRNKTPETLKKLFERNIKAAEAQADDINNNYGKGKQILLLVPSAQASVAADRLHLQQGTARQATGTCSRIRCTIHAAAGGGQNALITGLFKAATRGFAHAHAPEKNAKNANWDDAFNHNLRNLAWADPTKRRHSISALNRVV